MSSPKNPFGTKHDQGKPAFDLIPPLALEAIARVLEYGARKYAPDNWRHVKDSPGRRRYYRAALGHLNRWKSGELVDPETGESHLAHTLCCVLFELEREEERRLSVVNSAQAPARVAARSSRKRRA